MRSPSLFSRAAIPATITVLFLACDVPETGYDKTILTGTATIPPASVTEVDTHSAPNDATPQPLGDAGSSALTYRAVMLSGTTSSWTPKTDSHGVTAPYGDADLYAFSPVADGTFTVTLSFATGANPDTAAGSDAVVYDCYIVDATTLDLVANLGSGSTDGSGGTYTASADVLAGGSYILVIGGISNANGDTETPYTAVLSGSAPVENTVLVGAYLESDPAVASAPVGGTTVTGWTFDTGTNTWNGTYTVTYLLSVTTPVDTSSTDTAADSGGADTAPVPSPTVDNALTGPIYLMAGTLTNLNGTPAAGSLYSTVAIQASATDTTTAVANPIVLDALFPKVIGVQATEATPDTTTVSLDANYALVPDTLVAQDLGMLSGLGYVDTIDGSLTLAGTGWAANDGDAYSFTVPAAVNVRMTASWSNTTDDLDFGIFGDYQTYGYIDWFSSFGSTYCLTGSDPEACATEVQLEPDTTYYLVALGYAGNEEEPYHIELEWTP